MGWIGRPWSSRPTWGRVRRFAYIFWRRRMLTDAQVAKFKQDGYIKGGKVLSDDQVEVLRDEVLRVIRDKDRKDIPQPVMCHNMGKAEAPVWQIVNIWMASAPFRKLIENA